MTDQILHSENGFAYRRLGPVEAGRQFVLLHGSGADETQLLAIAGKIDPHAALLAVRGRVDQNGERRWFRKLTPISFDQTSIRAQARAFRSFILDQGMSGSLDPRRAVFVGYSNGGNLLHATMLLHPHLIRRAILLRCMPVLRHPPAADLSDVRLLAVAGDSDETYGPYAAALIALLRQNGATVKAETVDAGHEVGDLDASAAKRWLAAPPAA